MTTPTLKKVILDRDRINPEYEHYTNGITFVFSNGKFHYTTFDDNDSPDCVGDMLINLGERIKIDEDLV